MKRRTKIIALIVGALILGAPSNFPPGMTFSDGTHNVLNALKLTFTGCTIGGTSPNATVSCTPGGGSSTGAGVDGGTSAQTVTGTGTVNNAARVVNIGSGWTTGTLTLPAISALSSDSEICINDPSKLLSGSATLTIAANAADSILGGSTGGAIGPYTTAGGSICLRVGLQVSAHNNWTVETSNVIAATTAPAHQFFNQLTAGGGLDAAQPAFADIGGSISVSQMNSGTGASPTTFWRGDASWAAPFSLTTTGSSGAATFSGGILNIPQYSGGGGSGAVTIVTPTGGGPISGNSCVFNSTTTDCEWTGLTGSEYEIRCHNVTTSNGSDAVGVQLGTGGTPTWDNTSGHYSRTVMFLSGTTPTGANDTQQAMIAVIPPSSGVGSNWDFALHDLSSALTKTMDGTYALVGTNINIGGAAATNIGATAVTGVRLVDYTASGTLSGGKCQLYTYSN